jgi:hypothetical protein
VTAAERAELLADVWKLGGAILNDSPKEILQALHAGIGDAIAAIPAMPADLTDAAAERDQSIVDELEKVKFGG